MSKCQRGVCGELPKVIVRINICIEAEGLPVAGWNGEDGDREGTGPVREDLKNTEGDG